MYRRDYLLRMIEEMGRIMARIRELLLGGEVVKAATELQEAARVAGLDIGTARVLDADSLVLLLRPTPDADPGRVQLAADLLELDALVARAAGREEQAAQLLAKSARLRDAVGRSPSPVSGEGDRR